MTARQALVKSKNGATVRIGMDAGIEAVLQLCSSAGIRSRFALIRHISRQQRSYAGRARDGIHDFSEWRLATEHAAYSGAHRGKRRNTGVEWEAAKHPEDRNQTRDRVRSAFVPRRCASIGNRKSRLHTVWAKEIPGRRKNRTAYDFTDALFAGYDSSFTCAVWAGFDKPQKIYRGAFGRELALPIWVDIMNAAAQSYPPREIKQPSSLKQIEICSRPGNWLRTNVTTQ
jgi:Membrane carboxypeptidase/penicillin-binding protein